MNGNFTVCLYIATKKNSFKLHVFITMKLSLFSFVFFFISLIANAQYTDVINSNKPGFSESPYSVGTGVYQFESNLFFRKLSIEPTFSKPQSFGYDLLFRTSFFLEKLELNAQITYQNDKIAFKNIFTSHYFTNGLSKLTIGGKYLLFQQEYQDKSKEIRSFKRRFAFDKKRLIPSVAIYLGVNTDFVSDVYKTGRVTPKVGVLLQNNLSPQLNIITNFYYDKIGSDFAEFSYIVTATISVKDRWSIFFENQGVYGKYQSDLNLGTGLAYLFSRDLQINSSLRFLFEGESSGFYTGLGVSYRINKHQNNFIEIDDNGNPIKKGNNKDSYKNRRRRKGFFGRFFGKMSGIFKKKN